MSNYLERKKKEKEEQEARNKNIATNADRKTAVGMGNNNINGETLSEWRARQKNGTSDTKSNDSVIRNVYGQTPEEYRKMVNSGQSLGDYDKWKGTSEQLLREYDKYSHSGKYQSEETHDDYAKRIEAQLKNTVKLKEKNEDKVSEIDDIIQRLSEASSDNDEGYQYFSAGYADGEPDYTGEKELDWSDEETFEQYQKFLKEAEAEKNKETARREKEKKLAEQFVSKGTDYSLPENTPGARSYQSVQSAKDKEAAQDEVDAINQSANLWQYGVNGLNPMGSQAGANYSRDDKTVTDGQRAIETKAVNDKRYADQLSKYEQEQQDITEKAAQAVKDPDFESKSQYKKSGWTWKGIIPYSSDPDYEYINNADGNYREMANHEDGNSVDEFGSEQARKGYDYIEDDEVKVYNYIYETEGRKEAEQYLESLNLTQRMTETKTKEASEAADEHPVIESLKTIPKNIFHAGQGYVGDLIDKAQGKPINTNSYANLSMNESNATRNTVTEGIGNPVGQFAYQTAMSMGDFLGTAAVSGVLSQTGVLGELAKFGITEKRLSGFIMGSNAATQGVLEAKERGLSDEQALMTGLAQGITEEVFEEFSLERLKIMATTDPKTLKNVFVNVAKQAFTEGSEELFTDMANAFTDLVINGDEAENMQKRQAYIDAGYSEAEADKMVALDFAKQLGLSFAGGAVSGGVMGGLASGLAYNFNKRNTNAEENVDAENLQKNEENLQNNEEEEVPWEEKLPSEGVETSQTANNTEENLQDNEEIPWEAYEALMTDPEAYYGTAAETGTETVKNGTKNREVAPVQPETSQEQPEKNQKRSNMAQIINTVLTNGKVTDTVADEIVSNADLKSAFEEQTGVTLSGNDKQQANAVKEIVRMTAERGNTDIQNTERAAGEITKIAFENGGNITLKDNSGNSYTYQEALRKNPEMKEVYTAAARVAIENGTQAANVFLQNYSTSYPAEIYGSGFRMMYNAGKNGIPFEVSVNAADYVKDTIGQTIMKKAWDLGRNAKQTEDSKVEVKPKKQKRKGTGTYENQTAERSGGLPELERLVANRTGIDIARKSGLDHNANGSFTASTMTMLLNENAQNEYTALIHELGEFGLAYDRDGMKNLQESLVRYWVSKEGITGMNDINSLVDEYQRRYSAVEGSKTRSQAMDEMVNDALGGLFSSDEGVQEFADWLKKDSGYSQGEQKTIVQRFVDMMDSIVKYLKEKLKDLSLTKAARKALELERQQAEDIRKQFLDVLDQAIEEANTTGEYQTDTDVKYHISDKFSEEIDKTLRGELNETERVDEISYEKIIAKEDMKISKIAISKEEIKGKTRKQIVEDSIENLRKKGLKDENKVIKIYNKDTGKEIVVGKTAINHGLDRNYEYTAMVSMHLDSYLENAIKINEVTADTKRKHDSDILLGYGETEIGEKIPAYFVVSKLTTGKEELIEFGSLYSLRAKKVEDSAQSSRGFQSSTSTEINIANLIELVKETYSDILPKDVAKHYGITVRETPLGKSTKFSLPEEYDRVRRENETLLRENETFKQIIDSLEHTLDIKEGVKLNEQSIEKAAKNMLRKYKSNVDPKSFVENVTALFQAAAKNEMSASDFEYLAESIVRPLIEQSENNLQISDYAKDVLSDIKKTTIKLDGIQKKESAYHYGSYGNLRKSLFGRANFSEKGTQLDILWKQWSEAYPDLFDTDISPVDQPVKLAEIIKNLKEDYVNEYGFDIDDAVSYAAAELLNEYASIPEVESVLDAKKKSEFRVRYRELTNVIKKDYQQRYEGQIKELKQKNAERISKMSAQNRDRLLRQEAKYRARMTETRSARLERQEKAKYKDSIVKGTKSVLNMLEKNSDKYHVPEVLKNPTVTFLNTLDFSSKTGGNQTTRQLQNRLSIIADKFGKMENSDDGMFMQDLDPDFVPKLNEMIAYFASKDEIKKISEMDAAELKDVAYLVNTLKRTITMTNELIGNRRYQAVAELGNHTIGELRNKKTKPRQGKIDGMADNLMNMEMLDSRSFFEELGEGAESIYQEMREGFNKRTWLIKDAQAYMEEVIGDQEIKHWTGKKAGVIEFEHRGENYEITTGQLMNLYILSKRPQAQRHLFGENGIASENGGFSLDKHSTVKKQKTSEKALKMSKKEMQQLFSKLTPEQKRIAEQMQIYLAKNCADWGNETSMTLYGYKKFGEKFYWPIKTDENTRDTMDSNTGDNSSLYAIKNQGMTKSTDRNANNPLIIGDIFDVFTEHVTGMANYNAFCIPISDAMKWYNFRSRTEDGILTGAVKEEMERALGIGAKDYFVRLIKDINGESNKGTSSEIANSAISKYKAAAVAANMRVAIQQPTAYLRASAMVDPVYLAKGMTSLPAIAEMQQHSAIGLWKSWGYFETGLGQSMKQVITGEGTRMEKLVELSMKPAGFADDATWGFLWNAVKAEVADKNKGIDTSSEYFMKLVSERFDKVIDKTQVVDTVLHRSQIMRSKDTGVKVATAFMAEPTKTYNLLRSAWVHGDAKTKARTITACVSTALLTATVASFADAFRDKDEEKDWFEKYAENFKANVIDGVNFLNTIPYIKETINALTGNESDRMDMAAISSLATGITESWKYLHGESNKTFYGIVKSLTRGVSQLTGVPAYNALREIETVARLFVDIDTEKPTAKTVRIRLLRDLKAEDETDMKKWLAWYDEQYEKKIEEGKEKGKTDKKAKEDALASIKSSITSQYKEIYQKSTTADKIKIKQLLLKIKVGNKQLFNGYNWSSWDKTEKKTEDDE